MKILDQKAWQEICVWFHRSARPLYPKEFALSENWWMAIKAIEHVGYLKAFGRTAQ